MDIDYDNLFQASDDDLDLFSDSEDQLQDQLEDQLEDQLQNLESIEKYGPIGTNINNNLIDYLETLENKLQNGKLDDYTFMLENLLVNYKQALIHRRFNVDNKIDADKIERIRVLKSELEQDKTIQDLNINFP